MNNKTCGECRYYVSNRHGGCCTFIGDAMCDDDCACDNFEKPTVFDTITASPEVLAEKLVYCVPVPLFDFGAGLERWYTVFSPFDNNKFFRTKEEAIAATEARLKEVEK